MDMNDCVNKDLPHSLLILPELLNIDLSFRRWSVSYLISDVTDFSHFGELSGINMDSTYFMFAVILAGGTCLISGSFVNVPNEPSFGLAWAYQYDQHKGVAAMRNNYRVTPNDTCHVFKLTDQQRHDIHSISGEFRVEVMMYEAIRTQHGELMTASELNTTSYQVWKFCKNQLHFLKYNFYV
ncbi:uncharacterized protein LOC111132945 [Crassostrea virginica]|uniref:Uncharacterized protein LOC111132945 n=1 Tax=Crassostrea virginica TaxID=6565 RepID=A0A8B8EAS4_CRAVI|nr:uncharacterized protein LOC111132945 [Crassostrea virginica]